MNPYKYEIGSKEWKMYAGQKRTNSVSQGLYSLNQDLFNKSGFAPVGFNPSFRYSSNRGLGKGTFDRKSDDLKTSNFPILLGAILLYNLVGV